MLTSAPSANPNGLQIHKPRVGGPRRTGDPCRMGHPRLPWETVPQIHPHACSSGRESAPIFTGPGLSRLTSAATGSQGFRPPKAPDDCRTPRRFAIFGHHRERASVLDCGGKRSATPLSHPRGGLIIQSSSPARKRRRRSHSASALHDALVSFVNPNGLQIHQPRVSAFASATA